MHTRGARAAANQETPLSVCTVLKDKESGTVYHPFNALKVPVKSFNIAVIINRRLQLRRTGSAGNDFV